jgi:hypothetical protein
MEIILAIFTLLGGIAAIWFFWDRISLILKTIVSRSGTGNKKIVKSGSWLAIDKSYRQHEWFGNPTKDAGYSDVLSQLTQSCDVIDTEYQHADKLNKFKVLILPTPFGTMVDAKEYENICQWVYRSGGLLVFGFYLMESHLFMNINNLVRRFQ